MLVTMTKCQFDMSFVKTKLLYKMYKSVLKFTNYHVILAIYYISY